MALTRREMLKLSALAGGALMLPLERRVLAADTNRIAESQLPPPFTIPFAVPAVLKPVRSEKARDLYSLTMREGLAEIIPGYRTRVWGFNGTFPGPTFDVERGRPCVVRQINQLPATHPLGHAANTSVHLHGAASYPQFDGYANDLTYPGYYKDYHYGNTEHARTLWYHDHAVHRTSPNVYLGLAGMYRVHDPLERSLPIPSGAYDVPLVISDAMFTGSGDLLWDDQEQSGLYGDVILVNGRPWPVMKVEQRKYRFRILNASVSRLYRWYLQRRRWERRRAHGGHRHGVGPDAGAADGDRAAARECRALRGRHRLREVPGRATPGAGQSELGEQHQLHPHRQGHGVRRGRGTEGEGRAKSGRSDTATRSPTSSTRTTRSWLSPKRDAATTRVLSMDRTGGQWTINGMVWDDVVASNYQLALAQPELNSVEVWELRNDHGGWHHPLHIHLVDFRILDRTYNAASAGEEGDDAIMYTEPPRAHELGPKDTVNLGENERVRVIAKFGPHPGKYMIHCHNLVHEDHDMMGQFIVGDGGPDPISTAPCQPLPAPRM